MKQFGCIGKALTLSFSKEIHAMLADYTYDLIELAEDELAAFFEKKNFAAINVTDPYKQAVIPYLDSISDIAKRIGAVNIIVNRDGKLYGCNTEYQGMQALIARAGLDLSGKKVRILGDDSTSKTAQVLAADLGASEICIADEEVSDAQVIINTTILPDCDAQPIDLAPFHQLEGVIDVVTDPLYTNLVLDAKSRGIKAEGGLYMLVMQAVASAEHFLGTKIPHQKADEVFARVLASRENIVLTGMPGSGKSTVGNLLKLEGFTVIDTDDEVEKRCGCKIRQLFEEKGEAYFRDLETEVIRDVSREGCRIISTGGGSILREENVRYLKQNGRIFFLNTSIDRLQISQERPLSDTYEKLIALYNQRMPIYLATADVTVPDLGTSEQDAKYVADQREKLIR